MCTKSFAPQSSNQMQTQLAELQELVLYAKVIQFLSKFTRHAISFSSTLAEGIPG